MILIDPDFIIWIMHGRSYIKEQLENFINDIEKKLELTKAFTEIKFILDSKVYIEYSK
jgi:hypothetical protein